MHNKSEEKIKYNLPNLTKTYSFVHNYFTQLSPPLKVINEEKK
jgi:hypothetical protein